MKTNKDNIELVITWLGVATGFLVQIMPILQFVALVLAIFISVLRIKRYLKNDR
jgi:hypothetical protein